MTKYPYYIAVYFDAGILRKIFNDHKFVCYNCCMDAVRKLLENKWKKRIFERQIVILEYTDQYQGKIINVIENCQGHIITEPIRYDYEK